MDINKTEKIKIYKCKFFKTQNLSKIITIKLIKYLLNLRICSILKGKSLITVKKSQLTSTLY